MRKILIRAAADPLVPVDIDDILFRDLIRYNSGNLMFQYSVYRTLMTEGTEYTSKYFTDTNMTDEEIERINAEYDCVILPLANAFRADYRLDPITRVIEKLRVPCAVVGCGLQAPSVGSIERGFPFDESVKRFVRTMLEHSAMLGLRGELTAAYLKWLGFLPEKHFTVTGCPSMFSHGLHLPAPRVSALTPESRVSVNINLNHSKRFAFPALLKQAMGYDWRLVLQMRPELLMLRCGTFTTGRKGVPDSVKEVYPFTASHTSARSGRVIGFVNAHAWHTYMQTVDMSFGNRIHGNIAAVLGGAPALVLTADTRMAELAEYHNIPHVALSTLNGETDLVKLHDQADFGGVLRGHEQRFRHFVDFLNANGIDNIYRETLDPKDVPFDRVLSQRPIEGEITAGKTPIRRKIGGYRILADRAVRKLKKKVSKD